MIQTIEWKGLFLFSNQSLLVVLFVENRDLSGVFFLVITSRIFYVHLVLLARSIDKVRSFACFDRYASALCCFDFKQMWCRVRVLDGGHRVIACYAECVSFVLVLRMFCKIWICIGAEVHRYQCTWKWYNFARSMQGFSDDWLPYEFRTLGVSHKDIVSIGKS